MSDYSSRTLTDIEKAHFLYLAITTRREFEQRLDAITVGDDFEAKPEGDAICMLILILEILEKFYTKKEKDASKPEGDTAEMTAKEVKTEPTGGRGGEADTA